MAYKAVHVVFMRSGKTVAEFSPVAVFDFLYDAKIYRDAFQKEYPEMEFKIIEVSHNPEGV